MKITLTTIIMLTLMILIMIMLTKLSKKNKMMREKNTPFECGFSMISSARKPFSIQFFMVAMLFLVFDMEISMMLPMISTKMTNLEEWMKFNFTMILILIMGLMHEWNNGMLEWSK